MFSFSPLFIIYWCNGITLSLSELISLFFCRVSFSEDGYSSHPLCPLYLIDPFISLTHLTPLIPHTHGRLSMSVLIPCFIPCTPQQGVLNNPPHVVDSGFFFLVSAFDYFLWLTSRYICKDLSMDDDTGVNYFHSCRQINVLLL